MSQSFEKQVVLITGGSTGIGEATALEFARAGAEVVITGRHEATLEVSASRHERIAHVVADISKVADVARSIETIRTRFGRLDVLVNNAGIAEASPLGDASIDHVERILAINVVGLIETTRVALPLLRRTRGSIVNVASVVADRPFANISVYSASKAAVLALTRSWAKELAPDGVRVNAVSPGPIATPIFTPEKFRVSESQLKEMGTQILGLVPMHRFGQPEEVAQVITFLASPAASYVTGAQYKVGGGIEA